MKDRKKKNKMTDWVTKGKFGANHQPYCGLTTDQKEKKSPRFAFLKISAFAHLAHSDFSHRALHKPENRKEPNLATALIFSSFDTINS